MRDDTLSRLCALSRAALWAWKEAGRPTVESLHERKCDLRRQVRRQVNCCAALAKRKHVQRREKLFKSGDEGKFKTPFKQRSHCSKLLVGGKMISNPEELLSA